MRVILTVSAPCGTRTCTTIGPHHHRSTPALLRLLPSSTSTTSSNHVHVLHLLLHTRISMQTSPRSPISRNAPITSRHLGHASHLPATLSALVDGFHKLK